MDKEKTNNEDPRRSAEDLYIILHDLVDRALERHETLGLDAAVIHGIREISISIAMLEMAEFMRNERNC